MSSTDASSALLALFTAADAEDWDSYRELLDDNVEAQVGPQRIGDADALVEFQQTWSATCSGAHHGITSALSDGDGMAAEVTFTGTQQRPSPWGKDEGIGEAVEWRAAVIGRLRDGRIASYNVHFDFITTLGISGLEPKPGISFH